VKSFHHNQKKLFNAIFWGALVLLTIGGIIYVGTLIFYQQRAGKLITHLISTTEQIPNQIFTCQSIEKSDNQSRNELVKAIVYLKLLQRLNPRNSYTSLLLGRAYCLSGDAGKAVPAYLSYLRRHSGNPLGHFELGMAYERLRESSLSAQEWQAAGFTSQDFLSAAGLSDTDYPVGYQQSEHLDRYRQGLDWVARALLVDPGNQLIWLEAGRLCQIFFIEDTPLCNRVLVYQAGNWLVDPTFEAPNTWHTFENSPATKYEFVSCPGLSGHRCAHIQIDGEVPPGGAGFYQCLRPDPGKTYKFSSWIKTDISGDGSWCPLCFESRTEMEHIHESSDWKLWEYTFTATDFLSDVNCYFPAILNSQGQIWIHSPRLSLLSAD